VVLLIYSENHPSCTASDIVVTVVNFDGNDILTHINYDTSTKELIVYSVTNTNAGTYTLTWNFFIDSVNQVTYTTTIVLVATCVGEIGTITLDSDP
jgi:hypothetical protein